MKKYDHLYSDPDTEIVFHENEPDLPIIRIPLPLPKQYIKTTKSGRKLYHPSEQVMVNYGLSPEEQYFTRTTIPIKLQKLQKRFGHKTTASIKKCWEEINRNPEFYRQELKWIDQEWIKRFYGTFQFINGKPTYIDGWHYFYMNYWSMDTEGEGNLPDYRSRDRKFFIGCRHYDQSPFDLGVIWPKMRREGATSRGACMNYELISRSPKKNGGIQSMTENDSQKVFTKHIIPSWKVMPFFFKPLFEGSTNPKSKLLFNEPGIKITADQDRDAFEIDGLGAEIDFRSSGKSAYDGDKLRFYHGDEAGKLKEENVYTRHQVVSKSLSVGNRKKIVGFGLYTSTVGQMEKNQGGQNFKTLCSDSMDDKRNSNGQTNSGLVVLFISSVDGLEGFIDEYGNSVIDTPKEAVIGIDGEPIIVGAREYILNQRKSYEAENQWDALSEEVRMCPIFYKECFRGSAKDCNFNMHIIQRRLDDFVFGNKKVTRGNFEWESGLDSRVIWVPREDGRFRVSWLYPDYRQSNKVLMSGGVRVPGNATQFTAGGDPFKFKRTETGRGSEGGGAVFMRALPGDLQNDVSEWKGHRFVCTYQARPDKDVYGEDMLKMCLYYGTYLYAETNVPFLWEYFEARGFPGYLFYGTDMKTGRLKKTPGQTTNEAVREEIFREYDHYINFHGQREVHDELLQDCLDIQEDLGPFDRFVAGGYALLQAKSPMLPAGDHTMDMGNYMLPGRTYR